MIRTLSIALILAGPAVADTSILLRRSALVERSAPVRLRDVAEVSGDGAAELGARIIAAAPAGAIGIAEVRAALRGVNWGVTTITGARCTITIVERVPGAAPAPAAASHPGPGGDRLSSLVRERLALEAGKDPADVRVELESAEGLDELMPGRTVDLRPLGSGDRVPIRVTLYEGDRVVESRTIRAVATYRVAAFAGARALARGETIGPGDVAAVERWLCPREAAEVEASPVGAVLRADIEAGEVVLSRRVEREAVVKRGEVIAVDVLMGSFKIEMRGRARADANPGDVIEVETLHADRRVRRTVSARVSGPGRAVRTMGGEG